MKNLLRLIFIALVLVLLNAPAVAQLSVAPPPKSVTISSGVMAGMLLEKTNPVYPPIAKAAHVSGTVVLQATITKAGMIENLHVISGPDLLQQAALEAVKDWRYRPYLLMGEPVEVQTTVNVIFTLGGSLPQSSPDAGSQEAAPPLAQTTAVPPPPMPAPDGPSLAATMQFIQDKLQERGRLNFAVYTHDNADGKDYIDQYSSEASNIVADPAACSINYHRNVKKMALCSRMTTSRSAFAMCRTWRSCRRSRNSRGLMPPTDIPPGSRESIRRCFWSWHEERQIKRMASSSPAKSWPIASPRPCSMPSSSAAAAVKIRSEPEAMPK